jgi:O-antigen/teichoic acid export membrane protein
MSKPSAGLAQYVPNGPAVHRNSLFGIVGFLVPSTVVFAAYPLLIARLGPSGFGVFVLAISLVGIAGVVDLGIAPATTHLVARDLGDGNPVGAAHTVLTSLAFYALLGSVAGILTWLAAPWMAGTFAGDTIPTNEAVWAFRLGALQVGVVFLLNVSSATFKGLERFEWSALLVTSVSVASFGGALMEVTFLGGGLTGAMLGFVAGYMAIGAAGLVLLLGVLRSVKLPLRAARISPNAFRRLLSFGLVMSGNSIAGVLLYQVQRYLAGWMLGPQAVTVYQLATVIPSKVQTLIASATESLFPFASAHPPRDALRRIYLQMLLGGAIAALLLMGVIIVFRQPLLDIWLGKAIASQVSPLVPVFAAAYLLIAMTAAPFHLANGLGQPQWITALYLLDGTLNALLLLVLLPLHRGLDAIAWAFLIANLVTVGGYQVLVELKLWPAYRGS